MTMYFNVSCKPHVQSAVRLCATLLYLFISIWVCMSEFTATNLKMKLYVIENTRLSMGLMINFIFVVRKMKCCRFESHHIHSYEIKFLVFVSLVFFCVFLGFLREQIEVRKMYDCGLVICLWTRTEIEFQRRVG